MGDGKVRSLVPMADVADMTVSLRFYEKLGFTVTNQVTARGEAVPNWVWLSSDKAQLMLARRDSPVRPAAPAVLFYMYSDDVAASHAMLTEAGLAPEPIAKPFYNPGGEFRLVDPDGHVIFIAQI